jgi:hypothetical protein
LIKKDQKIKAQQKFDEAVSEIPEKVGDPPDRPYILNDISSTTLFRQISEWPLKK